MRRENNSLWVNGSRNTTVLVKEIYLCLLCDFYLCPLLVWWFEIINCSIDLFVSVCAYKATETTLKSCTRLRKGINEGAKGGRASTKLEGVKKVRARTRSISGLEETRRQSVSLSTSFHSCSPLFMLYERIDAGASTPSGAFMLRDGREDRVEINRLSFARSLVRKIVKHEVDGEINFINPSCKKLWTREFSLAAARKILSNMK